MPRTTSVVLVLVVLWRDRSVMRLAGEEESFTGGFVSMGVRRGGGKRGRVQKWEGEEVEKEVDCCCDGHFWAVWRRVVWHWRSATENHVREAMVGVWLSDDEPVRVCVGLLVVEFSVMHDAWWFGSSIGLFGGLSFQRAGLADVGAGPALRLFGLVD